MLFTILGPTKQTKIDRSEKKIVNRALECNTYPSQKLVRFAIYKNTFNVDIHDSFYPSLVLPSSEDGAQLSSLFYQTPIPFPDWSNLVLLNNFEHFY